MRNLVLTSLILLLLLALLAIAAIQAAQSRGKRAWLLPLGWRVGRLPAGHQP